MDESSEDEKYAGLTDEELERQILAAMKQKGIGQQADHVSTINEEDENEDSSMQASATINNENSDSGPHSFDDDTQQIEDMLEQQD